MIIITGANGFIGSCLLAELEQRGHQELVAVDPISITERPEILRHHRYSMFMAADQLFSFLKKVDAGKIQAIFHMGACSSTTETNEEYLRTNNTEYTQHLFSFCATHQIPFIYASSAATYGDGASGFDDQKPSTIYKPLNLYGWSKLNFDIWAEQQTQKPPRWAGLRFFNVFGPNEYHKNDMSSVVYKAFLQIRQSGSLKLFKSHRPEYADGMQMRDFVYVKDVTRWMYEIWKAPRFDNGIYNMGFGQARPWLDLAASVFRSLNREMNIDWIEMPHHVRNQYQYFTEAKMTKFQQQGLTHAQYALEDGVTDYVTNHLMQDNRYL